MRHSPAEPAVRQVNAFDLLRQGRADDPGPSVPAPDDSNKAVTGRRATRAAAVRSRQRMREIANAEAPDGAGETGTTQGRGGEAGAADGTSSEVEVEGRRSESPEVVGVAATRGRGAGAGMRGRGAKSEAGASAARGASRPGATFFLTPAERQRRREAEEAAQREELAQRAREVFLQELGEGATGVAK